MAFGGVFIGVPLTLLLSFSTLFDVIIMNARDAQVNLRFPFLISKQANDTESERYRGASKMLRVSCRAVEKLPLKT
jgi:hypothetical protein